MATVKQIEDAIFDVEGFRVRLTAFNPKTPLPSYDHTYMASNKWKVTEWQSIRMAPYVPFIRWIEVYRGDGRRTVSDMRLGHLRDTYFDEFCAGEQAALKGDHPQLTVPAVSPHTVRERKPARPRERVDREKSH